jgi:hypothetical protein
MRNLPSHICGFFVLVAIVTFLSGGVIVGERALAVVSKSNTMATDGAQARSPASDMADLAVRAGATITEVGHLADVGDAISIAVSGTYVYIGSSQGILTIVDVADPTSPQTVGAVQTTDDVLDVAVRGDYIYLADNFGQFRIINAVDPRTPIEIDLSPWNAYHPQCPYCVSIAMTGTVAYVVGGVSIDAVDVSTPQSPLQLGFLNLLPGLPQKIVLVGHYAYLASDVAGLCIIDMTDSTRLRLVGCYSSHDWAASIATTTQYAYVSSHSSWANYLHIYNISDPSAPNLVQSQEIPSVGQLAVATDPLGNPARRYLYMAAGNGLRILRIGQPEAVYSVAFYATSGGARAAAAGEGGLIYLADGNNGLLILRFNGEPTRARFPWLVNRR